jgi:phosphatidylserine/phosphatidylglycerophosphate/cardiolipin synthase-like enzyme
MIRSNVAAVALAAAQLVLASCSAEDRAHSSAAARTGAEGVSVYFAPETDLAVLVIDRIAAAGKSVHVQAYALGSPAIADALIAAHRRGLEVRIVLDAERAGEEDSQSKRLAREGIPTFADAKESKVHSKIMLIDGRTIVTGSYNFAEAQDKRTADNLILIEGAGDLVSAYEDNFMIHLEHAKRIKAR